MPRKFLGTKTVMKENVLARFDDNFVLEAYVQNYEGFQGSGDLMTKFGIRTTDELTLVISKERYEDFITPFYAANPTDELLVTRPKEGDLIYFPLSDSLFEIKFVEHESPFYQLGKLYMYQLTCELYEYEDEVHSLKPTIRIDHYRRNYLGYTLDVNDMGGQVSYREKYLQRTVYFEEVDAFLYLIDIQNPERISESLGYLGFVF